MSVSAVLSGRFFDHGYNLIVRSCQRVRKRMIIHHVFNALSAVMVKTDLGFIAVVENHDEFRHQDSAFGVSGVNFPRLYPACTLVSCEGRSHQQRWHRAAEKVLAMFIVSSLATVNPYDPAIFMKSRAKCSEAFVVDVLYRWLFIVCSFRVVNVWGNYWCFLGYSKRRARLDYMVEFGKMLH